MPDWIAALDKQRKRARDALHHVEKNYPSMTDRCAEVSIEIEACFDRVLEDPDSFVKEVKTFNSLLTELYTEVESLVKSTEGKSVGTTTDI